MGLLDDAIKEHLELKRRGGADPNEVDRLEREALGPGRRGAQPGEEPMLDQEPAEHQGAALYDDEAHESYAQPADEAYTEPADEAYAEPPEYFEAPQRTDEPGFVEEPHHERFPEDEGEQGWSHEPASTEDSEHRQFPEDEAEEDWSREPDVEAPPSAPAEPSQEPPDHPGGETVEYDVEAEETRDATKEDDVLEETPEFLQDTPDHDRLWFEQRPPRDFDFDK